MVLNDVRVRIMSKSSGGLVEGIVTLIDPATRLACISYNQNRVTGSESRKWVSFDETDPKLMVAGPETSLALPPSERIESFVDDTRRRIEGQAAIPVVTRGSLRMYQDKGYPEITSVYELALQATVIITSKSQGKDVVAVADLVTEDLQRCRVVYGGSYKWVPVTQTKPQLSVHRGVMPEDQK